MQIGTVKIDGRLVLAPMAGVTDLAFRRICRESRIYAGTLRFAEALRLS